MWGAADIANIWIYAAGILRLTLHHLNAHEIIIALRQMVVGQMPQLRGMINDSLYNMRFDLTVFYQTMQERLSARIPIARENFIT